MKLFGHELNGPRWRSRIGWFLLIYLGFGLLLYKLQERVLFRPVELATQEAFDFSLKHEEVLIPLSDTDSLSMVHFLPTIPRAKGAVLYFHGNKKHIGWYARFIPSFTKQGYEVYMIDYPGFGKSRGTLTEQKLYDWATIVYRIARKRFAADSLIIYGKSMGTGIAAELAAVRDCKSLILETPYYDFPSVLDRYLPFYPVRSMLHYQLPTYQYLPKVTAPITILHGTRDGVVSYSNAEKLFPLLKSGDKLVTVPGGSHNDLYDFELTRKTVDSILSK